MRIVDRYIARSIVTTFFSTIFIFLFLYVLIDIASNLSELINRKVPFTILLQYYASFFPIIIVQTAPIACLISVLLTFSHLNHNNEIIALRSSGMSFWKIIKPAITFGLIVSAFIFWVNERYVPQASFAASEIRNENIILKTDTEAKKRAKIQNLTFYGLKNRLYFIDEFDPNNFELAKITILGQDDNQNLKEKIIALKGTWTGIAWKFYQCHVTTYDPANPTASEQIKYFEEKLMDIKETPQDFMKQRLDVNSMNIRQLYDYIVRFSNSGAAKALNNLRVDLHQKIAFPFNNIAIMLVGLPLALMTGRRKALAFSSLGIAVAIGFLFYVFNAVGIALGKAGTLAPIISAWIVPIIFLGTAFYLTKIRLN